VVAYNGFIKTTKPDSPERLSALAALRKEYDIPETNGPGQRAPLPSALQEWPDERRHQFESRLAAIDKQYPDDRPATVKDFVDHIDYAVNLIGIDYVGISSDFDGGGGVIGWNDASETFAVTLELVRRGYNEEQIAKLWSGNLLRVMDEVQRIADELKE
jgi:membrane dipeptidase